MAKSFMATLGQDITWMSDCLGTLCAADKNQSQLFCGSHTASGKLWNEKWFPDYWPLEWGPTMWSHENGKILLGRSDCKAKNLSRKVTVQISAPARSFNQGASIKSTLLLMICICDFNWCVRCIFWLYICFTCDRSNISSINQRSTRVVAKFKKLKAMQIFPTVKYSLTLCSG